MPFVTFRPLLTKLLGGLATRRSRGVGLVASEDEDVIGLERVKRGEVRDLGEMGIPNSRTSANSRLVKITHSCSMVP